MKPIKYTLIAYCVLVLFEFISLIRYYPKDIWMKGMYIDSPVNKYKLNPNWNGYFRKPYSEGWITINSQGFRGSEPQDETAILLGDSYTFGWNVPQDSSLGYICDAYNMGVPGYNLPQIVEIFRQSDVKAKKVYYLYNRNDLIEPEDVTVYDGFLVTKGGNLKRKVRRAIKGNFWGIFTFQKIRQLIRWWSYKPEYKMYYAGYIKELQMLARQRGMDFEMVIIPSYRETKVRYSYQTQQIVRWFGGIHVDLTLEDYLPDKHLNINGLKKIAKWIK